MCASVRAGGARDRHHEANRAPECARALRRLREPQIPVRLFVCMESVQDHFIVLLLLYYIALLMGI